MNRKYVSSGGAVLLASLFTLFLMFVFLSSLMTLNALRAAGDRQAAGRLKSYYAARAGIEAGIHYLNRVASEAGPAAREGPYPYNGGARYGGLFFVHFHERGDGRLEGTVFEGAECEVSWEKGPDGAYIVESTGRISARVRGHGTATVRARVEEKFGAFHITGWHE